MIKFSTFPANGDAKRVDLRGAYVIGSDDVPLRAELSAHDGEVICKKRSAGAAGISLLWNVEGSGNLMLESIRVQERDRPYNLAVELARGRILRMLHKLEDWGLHDFDDAAPLLKLLDTARDHLIDALQADTDEDATKHARDSLRVAVSASEGLAELHGKVFLDRRESTGSFGEYVIGCTAGNEAPSDTLIEKLAAAADVVTVRMPWRDIEPTEQNFAWQRTDAWIEALSKAKIGIRGAPLLSFNESNVPDWLFIWEHDFDTIRDLAFEHVRRVINRYGQFVEEWTVVSGIHATNCFAFNFEQLMELTRMSAALTKQLAPRAHTILEIVAPFGEYYARNQRTIPPLLYADMAVQSGVNFDAFGLQIMVGPGIDGMFTRDMFQLSCLLDQFTKLGKPVHVTGILAPSSASIAGSQSLDGGFWRGEWSDDVQQKFMKQFFDIALSKPFIESVTWGALLDDAKAPVPSGGLLRTDQTTKPAFDTLKQFRHRVHANTRAR